MKCLSILLVLLFVQQTVQRRLSDAPHRGKRVVGGEVVQRGEAKFMASLWYMKPNEFTKNTGLHHVCGGTLIHPQWILTSASCFSDAVWPGLSDLSSWQVKMGEHDLNETVIGVQTFSILQVFKAPMYNLSLMTGDMALLKLNASAVLDDYTGTLPVDNNETECAPVGASCMVYGWGQLNDDNYGYGSVLPYGADVSVWSNTNCSKAYNGTGATIGYMELCAASPGKDACYGDMGGSLVCTCADGHAVASAVVYTGIGCADSAYPGIYERVGPFTSFISSTIRDNTDVDSVVVDDNNGDGDDNSDDDDGSDSDDFDASDDSDDSDSDDDNDSDDSDD